MMDCRPDAFKISPVLSSPVMVKNKDTQNAGFRVLIIDDEPDICELIRFHLEEEGYLTAVSHNGIDAWNRIEKSKPDAVILDLMLPGISGLDLCKKIKGLEIPILMVTAKSSESDAVIGLELGADDYIRKPFSPRELTARLRAVLRRTVTKEGDVKFGSLTIGKITMDADAHRVMIDHETADLSLIEYKILELFMRNPDIAFTRDRLLDRIWGRDIFVSDRTVDVNIKRLREKLKEEEERLETVRGVGYRFRGEKNPG